MIDGSLIKIDDPELAREIEKARMRLLLDQPSLAAAVMRIPAVQVPSEQLPGGIGASRGAIVVSQALRLTQLSEIAYGYAHNIVHVLFEHLERRLARDRATWSLAIDIATAALLDPLLDPALRGEPANCDTRPVRSAEFAKLVASLGHLSCEQIYEALVKGSPLPQPSPGSRGPAQQWQLPPNTQPLTGRPTYEGCADSDGHAEDIDLSLGIDAELSAEDRALVLQEIGEALSSLTNLPGNTAGKWTELAKRARTRAVPWERVFSERLDGLMPIDFRTYPFAKRHLWRGIYMPSLARVGIGRVLFAIDTSGSMSIELLGRIVDQIDQLRQATGCSLTIVHFDTQVTRTTHYDDYSDPITRGSLEMPGRGGTDIRAPFVYANAQLQEGERLAGIVVATDGYGPLPTAEPRVPVIWLLPAREAAAFRPPFGGVIAINAPDGSAWDGRH